MIQRKKIAAIFEQYHHPAYLEIDPLVVVHRYKGCDSLPEIALTAALLSYGRVSQIIKAIETILLLTHDFDFEYLNEKSSTELQDIFRDFKYRFHVGTDIVLLIELLKQIRFEHSSLTSFAEQLWNDSSDGKDLFNRFTQFFKDEGKKHKSLHREYFDWLFPSPHNGSPSKRIAMFFRWMVRDDDGIDLGLWQFIPTKELYIPVDTHVARVSQQLGLTTLKNGSWKMAEMITDNLRKIDAKDPVKFDFSLCRFGMVE